MIDRLSISKQEETLHRIMTMLYQQGVYCKMHTETSEGIMSEAMKEARRNIKDHTSLYVTPKDESYGSIFEADHTRDYRIKLVRFAMIFLSDDNRKQIEEMME